MSPSRFQRTPLRRWRRPYPATAASVPVFDGPFRCEALERRLLLSAAAGGGSAEPSSSSEASDLAQGHFDPVLVRPLSVDRSRRSARGSEVDPAAATDPSQIFMDPALRQKLDTPRNRRAARGYDLSSQAHNPGPSAPPVSGTIEGINFDEDLVNNQGFAHIPPDPHGAAGPGHVVSVVNTSIEWHTKAGVQQNSQRLGRGASGSVAGSFFAPVNPETTNETFDPKVIYDQHNGRFVVVSLERQDAQVFGDPQNNSRILIAVSDDSDPNGTWRYQAISAKLNIGGADTWADYPGLAVDAGAIYITANMFTFGIEGQYAGSRLWIVNKTNLYAGTGNSTVTLHDPAGVTVGDAFTLQPAHMFGAAPGTTGTFLVNSGFNDAGGNEFLSVIRVSNPLTSPTFTNTFIATGNTSTTFFPPGSPQMGTARTIDSGDSRAYNAVWRDNTLWTVNTVAPPSGADAGTATVRWYKVTANSTLIGGAGGGGVGNVADQGNVSGEDIAAGTRTFYPAVNVDAAGNMGVGFSASGPGIFPGAYYTGRLAADPAGTVQPSGVVAAGVDFYFRDFDSGANRWGDYNALAIDPTDNLTFWAYNEYALARGSVFTNPPSLADEDGRWGTRWARFNFAAPPNQPPVVAALADSPDPVQESGVVVLTASGVSDPDGTVAGVAFYRESNTTPGLQTGAGGDALLGTDADGSNGYTLAVDTAGLPAGTYTYYAQATDDDGAAGNVTSTANTVVAVPPAVVQVYVNGTAWSSAFRTHLQNQGLGHAVFGFAVPDGAAQLDELPWTNLNQVSVRFTEHVDVQQADLSIYGVNVAGGYALGPFNYDPVSFTATWTLAAGSFRNDKLLLVLDGDAGGGVADASGNRLDGEWVSGADAYPSGDGTAGGDLAFRLNVLPGDANRSGGRVGTTDLTQTRNRQLTGTTAPGTVPNTYSVFHDVNGSGRVDSQDVTLVRNKQLTSLPPGEPTPPQAALTRTARSTSSGAALAASVFGTQPVSADAERQAGSPRTLLADDAAARRRSRPGLFFQ